MINVTATHINYYFICKRKLWLFGNGINMEQTSDLVAEGKLVHETSYSNRPAKYEEVMIGGSVIDYYDPQSKIIHEIKKSPAKEEAHLWQVKYYIYLFEQEGISEVSGILEYPLLRETLRVDLEDADRMEIQKIIRETREVVETDEYPSKLARKKCVNCSYFDFCYTFEESDI